eukprot:350357-Chlamydomonas_euryale.AAC.3
MQTWEVPLDTPRSRVPKLRGAGAWASKLVGVGGHTAVDVLVSLVHGRRPTQAGCLLHAVTFTIICDIEEAKTLLLKVLPDSGQRQPALVLSQCTAIPLNGFGFNGIHSAYSWRLYKRGWKGPPTGKNSAWRSMANETFSCQPQVDQSDKAKKQPKKVNVRLVLPADSRPYRRAVATLFSTRTAWRGGTQPTALTG